MRSLLLVASVFFWTVFLFQSCTKINAVPVIVHDKATIVYKSPCDTISKDFTIWKGSNQRNAVIIYDTITRKPLYILKNNKILSNEKVP